MVKREKENNKQHRTHILFLLCINLLLINALLITSKQSTSTYIKRCSEVSTDKYTENGQVHTEVFIEWPFSENLVSSYTLHIGSIFRINYTVLPISFSNVSFEYLPELGHENQTIFSPNPPDFILVPGESYTETFTVVNGTEDSSFLLYKARPLSEESNATVHWWFEVLKYGEASVPGVLFSFGTLAIFAIVVLIIKKRRKSV